MEYLIQNEFVFSAMYQFVIVVQYIIVEEQLEHFLIVDIHVYLIANYQQLNELEYEVVDEKTLIEQQRLIQKNSNYLNDFDQEYVKVDEPE